VKFSLEEQKHFSQRRKEEKGVPLCLSLRLGVKSFFSSDNGFTASEVLLVKCFYRVAGKGILVSFWN
jgi:hypothetical protein